MASTKLSCKENRYLLSPLPFYKQCIPVADFDNIADDRLPSRNTLNSLPSLFDIDLFKLNGTFDNEVNPDYNLYNNQRNDCLYSSPTNFDICKQPAIEYRSSLSFMHNNVRSLKKNLEAFQSQQLHELRYQFTILAGG